MQHKLFLFSFAVNDFSDAADDLTKIYHLNFLNFVTLEHVYVRKFLFQRLKLLTIGVLQHRHEFLFKDPKDEKAQDLNQEDWHKKLE